MKNVTIEELNLLIEDVKLFNDHLNEIITCDKNKGCENSIWLNNIKNQNFKYVIINLSHDKNFNNLTDFMESFAERVAYTISLDGSKEFKDNIAEKIEDIIAYIAEYMNDMEKIVSSVWTILSKQQQEERLLKYILNEELPDKKIGAIWKFTDKDIQNRNIIDIMQNEKLSIFLKAEIWINTDKDIQKQNSNFFMYLIQNEKLDDYMIALIWESTDKDIQNENITKLMNRENLSNDMQIKLWKTTHKEVQRQHIDIFNRIMKSNIYLKDQLEIWESTDKTIQEENIVGLIKSQKYFSGAKIVFWRSTDKDVQNRKIIELIKTAEISNEIKVELWKSTDKDVQNRKIIELIQMEETSNELKVQLWETTHKEVQKQHIDIVISFMKNEELSNKTKADIWCATDGEVQKEHINIILEFMQTEDISDEIKIIIWQKTDAKNIKALLESFPIEIQKNNYIHVINALSQDNEKCKILPEILKMVNEGIDTEKLAQILTMKDNEYLNIFIIQEILIKNIDNNDVDIQKINGQIDDIFRIFCTNNLPEVFKLYEFFKFHPNHDRAENQNLYEGKTQEERDRIILSDLFQTALDSNNKQLKSFFELLHNGNLAYSKKQNGLEIDDKDKALISAYSDILVSLYNLTNSEKIINQFDYMENIEAIRLKLNIGEKSNIGEIILSQFLNEIGFKLNEFEQNEGSLSENYLSYMDNERKRVLSRNSQQTNISDLLEERRFNKGNIN